MNKAKLGNWLIGLDVLIYVALSFIFLPEEGIAAVRGDFVGELFAGIAMILLSIGIFLSTKPKWLEPYFGGLDKMYATHRQIAVLSLLILVGHVVVIPNGPTPGPGLWLGMIAFYGFLLTILMALAPRLPVISNFFRQSYSSWRKSHRLVGVLYLLSIFHYLMVDPLTFGTPQGLFMFVLAVIGGGAWIYKLAFASRATKTSTYEVTQVNKLNGAIVELVMEPKGEKLEHKAGQFCFIHFDGDSVLEEPHPFTIASSPNENQLRLGIKNSGDWTNYLYENAKPGMEAQITGGHGMFNYKASNNDQIWIAGGIGITPFTSWARDMVSNPAQQIDFFYTVRSQGDVIFFDEFEQKAAEHDSFNAHLQVSNDMGRLTPKMVCELCGNDVSQKSVYLCGPVKMTESMAAEFERLGVASSNIHFEEFNFR